MDIGSCDADAEAGVAHAGSSAMICMTWSSSHPATWSASSSTSAKTHAACSPIRYPRMRGHGQPEVSMLGPHMCLRQPSHGLCSRSITGGHDAALIGQWILIWDVLHISPDMHQAVKTQEDRCTTTVCLLSCLDMFLPFALMHVRTDLQYVGLGFLAISAGGPIWLLLPWRPAHQLP